MLTLLFLLFVLVMLVSGVRAIGRASRRRRRQREQELALRRCAGMPFGSLFEQMLGGAWTRSYAFEPRTRQWVEMSDVVPDEDPEPERLSRTIIFGLPDELGRLALLRLHSARMPPVDVRLDELARDPEGMSPADLKAVCQEAGLAAMASDVPSVSHEDFTDAVERPRTGASAPASFV